MSALIGMSPTKALIKSSHRHWGRIKGSQQGLVEKVCCGFYVLGFFFSDSEFRNGLLELFYFISDIKGKKLPLVIISLSRLLF